MTPTPTPLALLPVLDSSTQFWITLGLGVFGIIVAVVLAVVVPVAQDRKRRREALAATLRPASEITIGWDRKAVSGFDGPTRIPYVRVTIHNKGETDARDMKITLDLAQRSNGSLWEYLPSVKKDEIFHFAVPLASVVADSLNNYSRLGDQYGPIEYPTVTLDWMDYSDSPRRSKVALINGEGF